MVVFYAFFIENIQMYNDGSLQQNKYHILFRFLSQFSLIQTILCMYVCIFTFIVRQKVMRWNEIHFFYI